MFGKCWFVCDWFDYGVGEIEFIKSGKGIDCFGWLGE